MGMTIDEALKVWLPVIHMGVETMPECKEALDMAIDTIRKYQKVKRIIKAVDDRKIGYATMMDALHKVIEDGNE